MEKNAFDLFTEPPYFVRHPQNQTVLAGQDVLLACQVGGDPQPDIHWRRKEADINLNKVKIVQGKKPWYLVTKNFLTYCETKMF